MSATRPILLFLVALVLSVSAPAQAVDKTVDKAARRLQLQLQNLQQQLQEAQDAKAKVEADKAEVDKQLLEQTEQVTKLTAALRKASDSLKSSEGTRAQLVANVSSLEKQLADQKLSSEEAAALKARELVAYTRLRDEQQSALQRKHDDQVAQVAECTTKNTKLIRLSGELLDRYRGKSVKDVLTQREPVLGLGDVQMFNLVQDYRDRADAERFTPTSPPAPAAPSVNR
jgi:chromosome segregation ATPase